MTNYLTADVTTIIDRNATVAEVTLFDNTSMTPGYLDTATGAAKRENGDRYDEAIAINLAVGRALESLGRQLRRRGEAAVRQAVQTNGS